MKSNAAGGLSAFSASESRCVKGNFAEECASPSVCISGCASNRRTTVIEMLDGVLSQYFCSIIKHLPMTTFIGFYFFAAHENVCIATSGYNGSQGAKLK